MEDVKKRGRPAKEAEESANENNSGADDGVPKKRGRPSNPNKKVREISGRGRGRPKKNPGEEGGAKESKPVANGNASGRGRPPKSQAVAKPAAGGRGRGRPKANHDDNAANDSNDNSDEDSKLTPSPKKASLKPKLTVKQSADNCDQPKKKARGRPAAGNPGQKGPVKRGRPKKQETEKSGDDSQDDVNSKSGDEDSSEESEADEDNTQ